MSVAEMKIKAIERLTALKDEAAVKEILEHIEKLNAKQFDTDKFFKEISKQYGDVLKKLAE
jgi:acetyl-CoA carboxylase beta subunit